MQTTAEPLTLGVPTNPDPQYFSSLVTGIWDRRRLTNCGPLHDQLELRLAAELDVATTLLTASGTAALHLALLDLPPGSEVITTAVTFAASASIIRAAGLTPVFVDIDPQTWNLDPELVADAVTKRTSAILAVHLFGVPCDVDALASIAAEHELRLIYDGAHAYGVSYRGQGIGRFGDATAFSLHATKLMHTGEGGALTATSHWLPALRLARNFGLDGDLPVRIGINAKLPEVSAALGLAVLRNVPQERQARANLRAQYDQALGPLPGVVDQQRPDTATPGELFYAICVPAPLRDRLLHGLAEVGVIGRAFPLICGPGTAFPDAVIRSSSGRLVAHSIRDQHLCLPFHGGVTLRHVERIADVARQILSASRSRSDRP